MLLISIVGVLTLATKRQMMRQAFALPRGLLLRGMIWPPPRSHCSERPWSSGSSTSKGDGPTSHRLDRRCCWATTMAPAINASPRIAVTEARRC